MLQIESSKVDTVMSGNFVIVAGCWCGWAKSAHPHQQPATITKLQTYDVGYESTDKTETIFQQLINTVKCIYKISMVPCTLFIR